MANSVIVSTFADQSAKSQTNFATQATEAVVEKVQSEHANRIDLMGTHLKVKISTEDVPVADFFIPLTTFSREDMTVRDLLLTPSIDYTKNSCVALGVATDLSIYRESVLFDYLTPTRQEYVEKMQTYHVYAALRNPAHGYSPEGVRASDQKTKRFTALDQFQQVGVTHEKGKLTRDDSTVDLSWTFDSAQKHILDTIQASTVPKPEKKKKKSKLASPTPDLITPEEACLDYQIVVTEEKLRHERSSYQAAERECSLNEDRLIEIQKRYDQEIQACKFEFTEDEFQFKLLEDEWSGKIREAEADIVKTETELALTISSLESKIAEEEGAIALLQKQSAIWISFREGPMIRNKATADTLNNAILSQKQNRDDHIRLTDEVVFLTEESAKTAEKKAMNDLCECHIQEVYESLPPKDIQEIENSTILSAELKALDSIFYDLTAQTDTLQRNIIHQTVTAQTMLESINSDNAKMVKAKLFDQKAPEQSIVKKLEDLTGMADVNFSPKYMYEHFQDLNEVHAKTGGLTVIGTTILKRKITKINLGKGVDQQVEIDTSLLTSALQPGFCFKVPNINAASVNKQSSSISRDPEFMNRINDATVQSKQKSFLGHHVDIFYGQMDDRLDENKLKSMVHAVQKM